MQEPAYRAVRILGILDKEEGSDPRSFMGKWIANNLNISSPILERAHRITSQKQKVFIVKYLNYKDTENILRAARAKKEVTYKDNKIRFIRIYQRRCTNSKDSMTA